jgi:hypothetical protein
MGGGNVRTETALIASAFPEMDTAEMASSSGGKEKRVNPLTRWLTGAGTAILNVTHNELPAETA